MSADKMFDVLKLKDNSMTLVDGSELPQYQFEQRRDRDVTSVLSKGFGDGDFAIMLGKALALYPFDMEAKAYMDAMLWRWKSESKQTWSTCSMLSSSISIHCATKNCKGHYGLLPRLRSS